MNKAMARHLLRQHHWSEAEILLAERVLRHDGTRRRATVLPTLTRFAEGQPESERAAWTPLLESLDAHPELVDALTALLAL